MSGYTVKNGASVIPAGSRVIEARAFYGDAALTEALIPEGVERIGENAFTNCRALRRVVLPRSLRALGAGAFRWCVSLERVALPEALTEVPDECFFGCAALSELSLPAALREIGAWAFFQCEALRALRLPAALERVGASGFRLCSALEALALPEGLRTIEEKAFFECAALRRVSLPASLEHLGTEAFDGCGALEGFSGPGEGAAARFSVRDGVLFADGGRTLLRYPPARFARDYAVPEAVTALAPGAFSGAKKLRTLSLPEGLRYVGALAFAGTELPFVRLPDGVEPLSPGLPGLGGTVVVCAAPELALRLEKPVFLGDIFRLPERARSAAAAGFLWAVEHEEREMEPWRERYLAYLRAERERFLAYAPGDETLLNLMLEEGLIPRGALPGLLDAAAEKDRTDLTAALLQYQRRHFGGAPGGLELAEDEEEPEEEAPEPPPTEARSAFYGTGDA